MDFGWMMHRLVSCPRGGEMVSRSDEWVGKPLSWVMVYTGRGHVTSKLMTSPSRVCRAPGLIEDQPMGWDEAAAALIGSVTEFHWKPGQLLSERHRSRYGGSKPAEPSYPRVPRPGHG